jgi:hypothetical protein
MIARAATRCWKCRASASRGPDQLQAILFPAHGVNPGQRDPERLLPTQRRHAGGPWARASPKLPVMQCDGAWPLRDLVRSGLIIR